MTAKEAVSVVKSEDNIFIGGGAVVPKALIRALTERHQELSNVHLYHILTLGKTEETAPYVLPGMESSFIHHAFFIGPNTRRAVNEGRAYYLPIFLSEVPSFLEKLRPDATLIKVSPPDSRGYCSLGTSVDVSWTACRSAKKIIAELNPSVPRTQGYSFIHMDDIYQCIETEEPLFEVTPPSLSDRYIKIGKTISEIIPDGACLQVGIGKIPDAVLSFLNGHKNLGVHSELISDGIMNLVESGVITNSQKSLNKGKVVTGIIMGSRSLYEWSNENPILEMRPSHYTNDVFNISRNDNVIAINQAISVDLKGQVCADSIGKKFYSGIGGQVDFIRGAARSEGGKPIIALPSTVQIKGNTYSRIVPFLEKGAGVVTSEGDVHTVITEFGAAELHHKGMGERAKALIEISHPDFRDNLERYAAKAGFKIT